MSDQREGGGQGLFYSEQIEWLKISLSGMWGRVSSRESLTLGGKGALTQQAHGEFIVSSETICLPNTQRVHGEYF